MSIEMWFFKIIILVVSKSEKIKIMMMILNDLMDWEDGWLFMIFIFFFRVDDSCFLLMISFFFIFLMILESFEFV